MSLPFWLLLHHVTVHCCGVTVRDKRREGQLVGGTNKKHMVTYEVDVTEKTQVRPYLLSDGSQPCKFPSYP